nr:hypothetical protein [Tanacetum cinerariifolium]
MQAPLRNRFRDLPEADMKEILHQRMWETNSYKSHKDHMQLFEALEKSINRDQSEELALDLAEARNKRKKGRDSPKTPPRSPYYQPPSPPPLAGLSGTSGDPRASGSQVTPPPPTSTNQNSPSTGSTAPSPAKTAATTKHQAWSTPDVMLKPLVSLTPEDLDMDEAMGPDEQAQLSNEEDIRSTHIPTMNLRQGWWKPFEEERPTTPKPAWSIRSSDVPILTNNWASNLASNYSPPPEDSLLAQTGPTYEIVKVFHPDVIHLQYKMEECHKLLTDSVDDPILRHNVSKPLPLGGPPGQVTIQSEFFFNKDLENLRYGSKGRRPALSISKMKAVYYPDARLEQMVPDQFWIEEDCRYDIAAMYGISHWWFQRQRFYINRHTSEGDRSIVRTHMRILSVVRIEVFSMYGYDYIKKIVIRHLNHLPPKDKKILTTAVNQWTRQLVIRQRVEDFQLGIESYQTQVNLTKPQWTATSFEYKHDYTVIESPRAVIFRDKYGVQMMMRFNEIHKFSDGTLQKIVEALDYRSAPASDHSKSRRTIESRAKRSSKIISLGHYSILLASSYTVKMGFNSLVYSLCALSALRRSGLRTASTAAKPYQGDSLEFYLITGSVHTDQRGTVVLPTLFNGSEQRHFRSFISNINLQESRRLQLLAKKRRQFTTPCPLSKLIINDSKNTYNTTFATLMYAVMIQDRVSMRVLMSQPHKMAMFHNKDE